MPAAMNLEHIDVPPNDVLSDMDKAYMVVNYPRPTPHASAPNWTLDYALKVSGVDPATIQDIKNAKGDVTKIRAIFTAFQVAARMKASASLSPNTVTPPTPNGTSGPAEGTNGAPVNGTPGPADGANGSVTNGTSPNNSGAANGVTTPSTVVSFLLIRIFDSVSHQPIRVSPLRIPGAMWSKPGKRPAPPRTPYGGLLPRTSYGFRTT
jgi:hypothetical protein